MADKEATATNWLIDFEAGTSPSEELNNFLNISFTHHLLLINKCSNYNERVFYISQAATQFWTVTVLEYQINAGLYEKQGKLPNNFKRVLPKQLDPKASQLFKDEYLMDFIGLEENADERAVEGAVVNNIKDFILRMGKGFSFIGNQYRIEVAGDEFFIDLLFFNRHLQSLVVFEIKRNKFLPEHAGKLNFYLNVLDEQVRLPHENASIGIILCKEKNNTVVEYSIKTVNKTMGIATYKTSKEAPKEIRDILPDTETLASYL